MWGKFIIVSVIGLIAMYFTIPLYAEFVEQFAIPNSWIAELDQGTKVTVLLGGALAQFGLAYLSASFIGVLAVIMFIEHKDAMKFAAVYALSGLAYYVWYITNTSNYSVLPNWFLLAEGVIILLIPLLTTPFFSFIKDRVTDE